jgi:hypothetical protein
LILDHEVLHRTLPFPGCIRQSGAGRRGSASMDKNDSMDFLAAAPILA